MWGSVFGVSWQLWWLRGLGWVVLHSSRGSTQAQSVHKLSRRGPTVLQDTQAVQRFSETSLAPTQGPCPALGGLWAAPQAGSVSLDP